MNNKGRLRNAFYSTLTSAIYQTTAIVCGFILPKLILDTYGSDYNGLISSITQFLVFFSVLQIGIQGSTRVALYKAIASDDTELVSSIMISNEKYYRKISTYLCGYILLIAILFPFIVNSDVDKIDIVLLVVIIGSSNFVQYLLGNAYKALLSADQSTYIINIIQTGTVILNTIICYLIIFWGGSIIVAKTGSALVYALNPMILYMYVRHHYRLNRQAKANDCALKGRRDVLANSLANIIHENVDVVAITVFCHIKEVSVYTVYALISNGVIRLMQVLTSGMEAPFGNMWAKHQTEILNINFRKYEYVMAAFCVLMTSCIQVLIIPFVRIYTISVTDVLYVREMYALMVVLCFTTMCIRTPYVTLVQAAGHYKQTKNGSFIEAMINIILTIVLVWYIGIIGALIGTVVANSFRSLQYGIYVSKNIINRSLKIIIYRWGWIVFSSLTAIVISNYAISFIQIDDWTNWVFSGVIVVFVSSLVLLISSLMFYRDDLIAVIKNFLFNIRKHSA